MESIKRTVQEVVKDVHQAVTGAGGGRTEKGGGENVPSYSKGGGGYGTEQVGGSETAPTYRTSEYRTEKPSEYGTERTVGGYGTAEKGVGSEYGSERVGGESRPDYSKQSEYGSEKRGGCGTTERPSEKTTGYGTERGGYGTSERQSGYGTTERPSGAGVVGAGVPAGLGLPSGDHTHASEAEFAACTSETCIGRRASDATYKKGAEREEKGKFQTARVLLCGHGERYKDIRGDIIFHQENDEECFIIGTIKGVPPGPHGMAVHERGDLSDGLKSAGGHLNPHFYKHGSLLSKERHEGDLGNIVADESGTAKIYLCSPHLNVKNLIGKSLILHEHADDYGMAPCDCGSKCQCKSNVDQRCNMSKCQCAECTSCNSQMNGNTGKEIAYGIVSSADKRFVQDQLKMELSSSEFKKYVKQQHEKFLQIEPAIIKQSRSGTTYEAQEAYYGTQQQQQQQQQYPQHGAPYSSNVYTTRDPKESPIGRQSTMEQLKQTGENVLEKLTGKTTQQQQYPSSSSTMQR